MTSVFDQLAFSARLFHPRDHDTLPPPGARDIMVEVAPSTPIHVRIHETPAARATILLFHGNGEVVADYDGFAPWYRDAGANLAIADFRGYGRCDGMPSLRTCLSDGRTILESLAPKLRSAGLPVIVMGRSLGSFVALDLASTAGASLDGLIVESGIGHLDAFVERRGFDPSRVVTARDREDFCPLGKAERVRVPTLILHGENDDLVRPENAQAIYEACASFDKKLVFIPERGHNDVFLGTPYWPSLDGFVRAVASPAALIFDLDGLLVDSEPTWFEVEGGFLAELGHRWTREDADRCMGQGTPNTLRIWRERFGVEVDLARDTERIIDRVIARADRIPLKPGVSELLDAARKANVPMAVASSSPRRLIEAVLAAKGIRQFFEAVASGQEVLQSKPAPDVFLRAAELLGVRAERSIVLEDALAGVRAGRAAGSRVIAIPSVPSEEFAALATWVLSDLHAARRLLF